MICYTAEELSKSYGDKNLFQSISFTLTDEHKVGLIGLNGTGKTSLLRAIAGEENADSGYGYAPKNIRIHYLPQAPVFSEDATVLSYIFESDHPAVQLIKSYEQLVLSLENTDSVSGAESKALTELHQKMDLLDAWSLEHQAKSILTQLGINQFNALLSSLSGGMRKRVALARALITPCDLLLLDEPTNHMDNSSIEWLEKFLQNRKGALMMITHDRYFLDRVANQIYELDRGKLFVYPGSYSHYLEGKDQRLQLENSQINKQKRLYAKELEWIRAGAQARSTKQKARIQRFESLSESMDYSQQQAVEITTAFRRLGKQVVDIENIHYAYGERTIIKDFTLIIQKNDRIGIVGKNGMGKTTLLKLIMQAIRPQNGSVKIGETVSFGYFTQETPVLETDKNILDYMRDTAEYVETQDGSRISASQMLERFLFPVSTHRTPVHRLSGGEKRRLQLLKTLVLSPNVLVLDEPTNDLDIDTLTVLENYLDYYQGVVIIVTHDRYFLDRTCTKIIAFDRFSQLHQLEGNYSENMEAVAQMQEETAIQSNSVVDSRKKQEKRIEKVKLTYAQKKALEHLPFEIQELETLLSELDLKMEQNPTDFMNLQKWDAEKKHWEETILLKMEELEFLENLENQQN